MVVLGADVLLAVGFGVLVAVLFGIAFVLACRPLGLFVGVGVFVAVLVAVGIGFLPILTVGVLVACVLGGIDDIDAQLGFVIGIEGVPVDEHPESQHRRRRCMFT